LPRELDSYVHRIGRTARSGKSGVAMSLVTPSHRGLISRIERMTNSKMKEGKIPTRKEVGIKKVTQLLEKFEAQTQFARAVELMDAEWRDVITQMMPEEIAGRFLSLMYPEIFAERGASATQETARPSMTPMTPVARIETHPRPSPRATRETPQEATQAPMMGVLSVGAAPVRPREEASKYPGARRAPKPFRFQKTKKKFRRHEKPQAGSRPPRARAF
jgi:superfamily II DNA/RNA helicase